MTDTTDKKISAGISEILGNEETAINVISYHLIPRLREMKVSPSDLMDIVEKDLSLDDPSLLKSIANAVASIALTGLKTAAAAGIGVMTGGLLGGGAAILSLKSGLPGGEPLDVPIGDAGLNKAISNLVNLGIVSGGGIGVWSQLRKLSPIRMLRKSKIRKAVDKAFESAIKSSIVKEDEITIEDVANRIAKELVKRLRRPEVIEQIGLWLSDEIARISKSVPKSESLSIDTLRIILS